MAISIDKTPLLCLSLCLVLLCLSGCSSSPTKPAIIAEEGHIRLSDQAAVTKALYRQHQQWQGTPYKLGGLTKRGVDCSGFVQQTFQTQLGYALPRSTLLQQKIGHSVDRNQLQAGDLVFFKTGRKLRHVGIYIEKETFLHASTSKGVIISSLNNPYWEKSYWKAVRPN